jgi:hypothetical protein
MLRVFKKVLLETGRGIDGREAGREAVDNGADCLIAACVLGTFRETRARFLVALDNI